MAPDEFIARLVDPAANPAQLVEMALDEWPDDPSELATAVSTLEDPVMVRRLQSVVAAAYKQAKAEDRSLRLGEYESKLERIETVRDAAELVESVVTVLNVVNLMADKPRARPVPVSDDVARRVIALRTMRTVLNAWHRQCDGADPTVAMVELAERIDKVDGGGEWEDAPGGLQLLIADLKERHSAEVRERSRPSADKMAARVLKNMHNAHRSWSRRCVDQPTAALAELEGLIGRFEAGGEVLPAPEVSQLLADLKVRHNAELEHRRLERPAIAPTVAVADAAVTDQAVVLERRMEQAWQRATEQFGLGAPIPEGRLPALAAALVDGHARRELLADLAGGVVRWRRLREKGDIDANDRFWAWFCSLVEPGQLNKAQEFGPPRLLLEVGEGKAAKVESPPF